MSKKKKEYPPDYQRFDYQGVRKGMEYAFRHYYRGCIEKRLPLITKQPTADFEYIDGDTEPVVLRKRWMIHFFLRHMYYVNQWEDNSFYMIAPYFEATKEVIVVQKLYQLLQIYSHDWQWYARYNNNAYEYIAVTKNTFHGFTWKVRYAGKYYYTEFKSGDAKPRYAGFNQLSKLQAYINNGNSKIIPHSIINRIEKGKDYWVCGDCGMKGTRNHLFKQSCKNSKFKPCEYCGQAPLCSPICPGIMNILNSPDIYVVGGNGAS